MKQVAALSMVLLVASVAAAQDKKIDTEKLLGEWTYVSGVRAGEKIDAKKLEGKVIFAKDSVTVPSGNDKPFVMTYKIDVTADPPAIEMSVKDGPTKGGKAIGIITLKGNELHLCYVEAKEKRPAKFESTKENEAFYFVLTKVK
jgi:uncharacterized protein (TIGR03067 family)